MNSYFEIDFIGVGAPKCSTTWLSTCLKEHPEITLSRHKETYFFIDPASDLGKDVYEPIKPHTLEEYKKEFEGSGLIKGEFSPFYFYDINALQKIKEIFSSTKILISLRNPINFLNSAYWFYKSSQRSYRVSDDIEEAIFNGKKIDAYYIQNAKFFSPVKACYDIFGAKNIHVILMRDIINDPKKTTGDLYKFVGASSDFVPPSLLRKVNTTSALRYRYSATMAKILFNKLRKYKLTFYLYDYLYQDRRLYNLYCKVFKKRAAYPKMPIELVQKIQKELVGDIRKLENLLQRDLNSWKDTSLVE